MLLKPQCTTTAIMVVDTYKQMRTSNSSHAGEPFAHFHPHFVGKSNYKRPIETEALVTQTPGRQDLSRTIVLHQSESLLWIAMTQFDYSV